MVGTEFKVMTACGTKAGVYTEVLNITTGASTVLFLKIC